MIKLITQNKLKSAIASFICIASLNAHAQCIYFKKVVTGSESRHSLGIKTDGTLWSWGNNQYGQLGDGTIGGEVAEPEQISTATNWKAIATGIDHSLAITNDGKLWAWGYDYNGQLGDGSSGDPSRSVLTPELITTSDSNWVTIASCGYNSFGITADGKLWAWGSGLLLYSFANAFNVPTQVGSDSDWAAIGDGDISYVAIKKNGTLWGWGRNGDGEAGDSTTSDNEYTPVEIDSSHNWMSVASGYRHTLALKKDGSLWAWGQNNEGELGNGTTIDGTDGPKQTGTQKWMAIGAGYSHSLGITPDGRRWAWGQNSYGNFGNDSSLLFQNQLTPALTDSSTNWATVYGGVGFSLNLSADGADWNSGDNDYEELGDGTNTPRVTLVKAGTPAVYPALATSGSSDVEYQRGFSYYAINCSDVITEVFKSGANPIHANTTAKVWIDATVQLNSNNEPFIQRHYEIHPANNDTTATGTVYLYFTQAEFTAYNASPKVVDGMYPMLPIDSTDNAVFRSNLRIERILAVSNNGSGNLNTYNGKAVLIMPSAVQWLNGRWQATFDVTGFGGFFATTAAILLPVNWLSVSGMLNSYNQAVINWKVNEQNTAKYGVEKSYDGILFNSIAVIISKGNGVNNYEYLDDLKVTGSLFYRIKQADKDGKFNYSKVIPLKNNSANITLTLFPNPAVDVINLQTNMPGIVSVVLSDLAGRILIVKQVQPGIASLVLNVSTLAKGIYQIKIINGANTTVTRFVKK